MDLKKLASEIIKQASRDLPTSRIYSVLKKAGIKVTGYDNSTVSLRYNRNDVVLHIRKSTDWNRYDWTLVESDIHDEREEKSFIKDFIGAMKSSGVKVAFNAHRLEIKFKEIDEESAEASDFLEERLSNHTAKLVKTKYRTDLDKNGIVQITFGSEFIESSIAIAKNAADLIKLKENRNWKGMSMYDTPDLPIHEAIKYDKVLKLYHMDTGFFD